MNCLVWDTWETIMKAKLFEFYLQDDMLQAYCPEDLTYFCAIAEMRIGSATGFGADNFSLTICSPKWLESNVIKPQVTHESHEQRHQLAYGRHYLFAEEYDEGKIKQAVMEIVNDAKGNDWSEIALYLSRYFLWEYEDHRKA